ESRAAVRFKLLSRAGQRVRRQYVAADDEPALAEEEAAPADDERALERAPPPAATPSAGAPALPTPSRRASSRASSELPRERRAEPPAEDDEPAWRRPSHEPASRASLGTDQIVKGYEFEKGRFVTFTSAELKALAEASRPTIDIVSFIPAGSVDPIYYDKAYYLAPDQRASKTYSLLHAAMQASGRVALAKWAWRAKEYVVQIRPAGDGFVLQQLLYADEVRAVDDLDIELVPVGETELALALRLIEQIAEEGYDPHRFVDEEKQRILAAVERKIAGRKVVAQPATAAPGAQVIDLVAALRASLRTAAAPGKRTSASPGSLEAGERKPARRAARPPAATTAATRADKSTARVPAPPARTPRRRP
ncbi:MAG TPA: Ku protein, partial [Caldimonas sp.]|nr:Ku protein [Caldimonas sp.]